MQNAKNYRTQVATRFATIEPKKWQALLDHDKQRQASLDETDGHNPFVSWAWFNALEASSSVGDGTGWMPLHIVTYADDGSIHAALPLYIKHHSYGEYVFDWAWADAYQRSGLDYYPKLLSAIPFTPVPGARLLARDAAAAKACIEALMEIATKEQFSSAHMLFGRPFENQLLADKGWMKRSGVQFHWSNPGWENFDAYLAQLSQPKRKKIKAERRKFNDLGLQCVHLCGDDISARDWAFFQACYANTYREHRSTPYLTKEFFANLTGSDLAKQCLLIKIQRDGQAIAASLCFFDSNALYGRYWGCLEYLPFVHFEASYYQPIEFAIERGIKRFEGGAQGEHKMARGFLPVQTQSMHWLAQPQFADAVARFLERESSGIEGYMNELDERNPFKPT